MFTFANIYVYTLVKGNRDFLRVEIRTKEIIKQKTMKMKIISTREFRGNQKKYFDLAEFERIIIHRGNKRKSVLLTPINEEEETDIYFSDPNVISKLKKALREIEDGNTKKVTLDDVKRILNL